MVAIHFKCRNLHDQECLCLLWQVCHLRLLSAIVQALRCVPSLPQKQITMTSSERHCLGLAISRSECHSNILFGLPDHKWAKRSLLAPSSLLLSQVEGLGISMQTPNHSGSDYFILAPADACTYPGKAWRLPVGNLKAGLHSSGSFIYFYIIWFCYFYK